MGHNYGKPLLKLLFGRASRCAFRDPDCNAPLIFEHRGKLTVSVDIAHIRSESSEGPRYDPDYPPELIDTEENLLLLCGIHHRPVDQHESIYSTEELLEWKRRQVESSAAARFSEEQLEQIVRSAMTAMNKILLTVDLVGIVDVGHGVATVPIASLSTATIVGSEPRLYVGVSVVNLGLTPAMIGSVGIDLDVAAPANVTHLFPIGESRPPLAPRVIDAKCEAIYPMSVEAIQAAVETLATQHMRVPRRFRPFVTPSAGDRVTGEWASAIDLPAWKPGMTDERLQELLAKAAETRRRLEEGDSG